MKGYVTNNVIISNLLKRYANNFFQKANENNNFKKKTIIYKNL